jgi:hypothetical protein
MRVYDSRWRSRSDEEEAFMSPMTPGAEDPIKYTKESLVGLRDVWLGFAQARLSKAAVALEQLAEKLPPPLKKKFEKSSARSDSTTTTTSSAANAPS